MAKVIEISRDNVRQLKVVDTKHRPHWQSFGTGFSDVDFRAHQEAKWLSIDTIERSDKTKAYKRTMITLDRDAAKALYDLLGKVFAEGENREKP